MAQCCSVFLVGSEIRGENAPPENRPAFGRFGWDFDFVSFFSRGGENEIPNSRGGEPPLSPPLQGGRLSTLGCVHLSYRDVSLLTVCHCCYLVGIRAEGFEFVFCIRIWSDSGH